MNHGLYDRMLVGLRRRRVEIDRLIVYYEAEQASVPKPPPKRRGRKTVTPKQRQDAREWMIEYWEKRKKATT